MVLETLRESGTSDRHRVRPSNDFDGTTRRQAMKDLLAKHKPPTDEPATPRAFCWLKRVGIAFVLVSVGTLVGAQEVTREHQHGASRNERVRAWQVGNERVAVGLQTETSQGAQGRQSVASTQPPLTPQQAADVMRRLDTPINVTMHPPCTDCTGPRVFIMSSTPGAASWLTFPPERERLRLDGTPISQPLTVYGPVLSIHSYR